MAKTYFIDQYRSHAYHHGGVGLSDVERIFAMRGMIPLVAPAQYDFSFSAKWKRLFFAIRTAWTLPRGATVFFLYPLYARMNLFLVRVLLRRKSIRLVCFITDIDGIRDADPALLQREIIFFRRLRYFIVHNERMREWLHRSVGERCSVSIGCWDLPAKPATMQPDFSYTIVYAGNLERRAFHQRLRQLEEGSPRLHFNLYGPGGEMYGASAGNTSWKGIADPYELPGLLQGSFGLLWDGEEIDRLVGGEGEYARYNTPHKLSLYILAGLPVIVPAAAATAAMVAEYGIGFSVNSLYEIQERLDDISENDYRAMQSRMEPLARQISSGQRLGAALDELSKSL